MQFGANKVDLPVNNDDLWLYNSMNGEAQKGINILDAKSMTTI